MYRFITRLLQPLYTTGLVVMIALSSNAMAGDPFLAFSDLISGPDSGLGDGKGSGVIVTLWGQRLGSSQGGNKVYFTDSAGTKREVAHVYYWKNADGQLPSGPANLYASHRMQEIAVSIPDSASGPGALTVEVGGQLSNAIDFTVRDGKIYHVARRGSESGNGSWSSPWNSVSKADSTAPAGSTIYIHDVNTGDSSASKAIYWNEESSSSSLSAQFGYVAYPGYRPKVTGVVAVMGYKTQGMVTSKLDIYSSNYHSEKGVGQPSGKIASGVSMGISTTKNGRAIANRIGDIPGGCASEMEGAIAGTAQYGDYVSNFKAIGNEIYDYGCEGSSKLHHTTYIKVRSEGKNRQVEPWEFGYNYLHGNKAKFGIHQWDQGDGCGDLTDTLRIHNNVIIDQAGAGISVGSGCDWSMDVEITNNVLINVGLAADWDGIDPDTSNGPENAGISIRDSGLLGTMYIENNTILGWAADGQTLGGRGCLGLEGGGDHVTIIWNNNICHTDVDLPFIGIGYNAERKEDNVSGSNNVWYYSGSSPNNAKAPSWDTNKITDNPRSSVSGSLITMQESSPVMDTGLDKGLARDIYGSLRSGKTDIGAIEISEAKSPPAPPSDVSVRIGN